MSNARLPVTFAKQGEGTVFTNDVDAEVALVPEIKA
jgi:hypothetical protein